MRVVALSAVVFGLAGPGCGRQELVVGVMSGRPDGGGQGGGAALGAGGAGVQAGSAGGGGDVGAGGAIALSPSCETTRFPSVGLPGIQLSGVPGDNVVGDWNRDGILDLAVAIPLAGMINVLLGKGDGTFLPRRDLATSSLPVAVAADDFNHDGNLDLVTANGAGSASVFLGKGNGTFATRVDYATGPQPNVVTIGDWTSDGKLDLIVGDTLFAGQGDGTFQRGVTYGLSPWSLVSADFNQDGYLDLMAEPNQVDQVVMLLGRGDGTFFQKSTILPSVAGPVAFAVGDFNADGRLDAAINEGCPPYLPGSFLYLLPGRGDGSFDTGTQYEGARCSAHKIWTGDIDGDGKVDMAAIVAGLNDDAAFGVPPVWIGNGHGIFSLRGINAHAVSDGLVAPADWNGDGKVDLAVYDSDSVLKVLPAQTDGSFGALPTYPAGGVVAVADVDGDGNTDLVFSGIAVMRGNGNGTFSDPTLSPLSAESSTLGDVDGDGQVDVVSASFGDSSVTVLPGTGDGTFGSARSYPTNGRTVFPLGVSDVNGDGEADIVVMTYIDGGPLPSYFIEVLFGRGDGDFLKPISSDAVVADLDFGAMSDLNGDRVPDVVIGNSMNDLGWQMTILLGKPDGTFVRVADYPTNPHSSSVAIGDLNRDGAVDLVTDDVTGDDIVWLGAGDGTFSRLDRSSVEDESGSGFNGRKSSYLVDVNGDGALDLAVNGYTGVTVLLGRGDGSFGCRERHAVDYQLNDFALGDLNHDGRLDLVTTSGVANVYLASH